MGVVKVFVIYSLIVQNSNTCSTQTHISWEIHNGFFWIFCIGRIFAIYTLIIRNYARISQEDTKKRITANVLHVLRMLCV